MKISTVIPCYNEEAHLDETLSALKEFTPNGIELEIVVVDNGSSDKSVQIALSHGVTVVEDDSDTVAGVRNTGVELTTGDILLFLDADVEVTSLWGVELAKALTILGENDVLGSHCSVPISTGLLARYWFKAIEKNSSSHIGTGHMILHKKLFQKLNGFDERLSTGEDYDFCVRVKKVGGTVIENEKLVVFHNGYPVSLNEFYSRELWHGVGDWQSIKAITSSKVLILSVIYVLFVVCSILLLWLDPRVGVSLFFGLQAMLAGIAIKKFGRFDGLVGVFFRTMVFNAYFMARFMSFLGALKAFRKQL